MAPKILTSLGYQFYDVEFRYEILYIVSCVRRPVLNALETPRDSLGVCLLGALKQR